MTTTQKNKPLLVLEGGRGIGCEVRGSALVSSQGFGVRYDLDFERGIIGNPDHDLYGESICGRILVFTSPKGGVAASWALGELSERNIAPLGIIFRNTSPIFVQGALFAGLPIMHRLNQDPCTMIKNGDEIVLKPKEGKVEVYR